MSNSITVTSPLLPDLGEFNEMLQQIWESKWITNMGQFHNQLPHIALWLRLIVFGGMDASQSLWTLIQQQAIWIQTR